jgi:hypothetical protein
VVSQLEEESARPDGERHGHQAPDAQNLNEGELRHEGEQRGLPEVGEDENGPFAPPLHPKPRRQRQKQEGNTLCPL